MEKSEENYQSTIFPHQLFDPLLKLLTTSEREIRLIVLEILQVFIDRRHNRDKLRKIRYDSIFILKSIDNLIVEFPKISLNWI